MPTDRPGDHAGSGGPARAGRNSRRRGTGTRTVDSASSAGRLRLGLLLAVAALAAVALAPAAVAGQDTDHAADLDALAGNGTADEPYVVTDVQELQAMERDLDAHYVLGSDVEARATRTWSQGRGFDPVGSAAEPFRGTLDGDGHAIRNLTVDRGSGTAGLFGALGEDARVERLALENVSVVQSGSTDPAATGGLAGRSAGEVRQVAVSGSVEGSSPTGGLVGDNEGSIARSYATARVGLSGYTGGLVGRNDGTLRNSYAVVPRIVCGGRYDCLGQVGVAVGDEANGTVTDVYRRGYPHGAADRAEGLSREAVTGTDAVETMAALDFEDTWRATPGYPVFEWQYDGPNLPGVGTPEQPFRIDDAGELAEIRENRSAHYVLASDLDADAISSASDGADLEPIGTAPAPFAGTFDGRGHAIWNLTIDRPDGVLVGLFGTVGPTGVVRNVSLRSANVTGAAGVGALVGTNHGTVAEVRVDGRATGDRTVGGLVGDNAGTVRNAQSVATVEGEYVVGGLVGRNGAGTVATSYAAGDVDGDVNETTGGLVGDSLGGVARGSYWDAEATGQNDSDGGTGLTTAETTGETARSTMDGLSFASAPRFEEPWVATDGYPTLASFAEDPIRLPGTGTADDPYLIDSRSDLSAMRADLDAHYRLTADVNASAATTPDGGTGDSADDGTGDSADDGTRDGADDGTGDSADDGARDGAGDGFEPVGRAALGDRNRLAAVTPFEGALDGDGHAIRSLTIDRPRERGVGLFAGLGANATVRDLRLERVDVAGRSHVGALAGVSDGTVENVTVQGSARAVAYDSQGEQQGSVVGGLVGRNDGTLRSVGANASVTGEEELGGLVGRNPGRVEAAQVRSEARGRLKVGGLAGTSNGTVARSVAATAVDASNRAGSAGGLVGRNSGEIRRSAAYGTVDGSGEGARSVGGLVGRNYEASIEASYARADVVGSDAGGLVGSNSYGGELRAVYATGSVSGSSDVGGLVGVQRDGPVTAAYWDRTATDQNASAAGTGLSTSELTGENATVALDGFDFGETWRATSSYPVLVGVNASWAANENGPLDGWNRTPRNGSDRSERTDCVATATVAGQTVCDTDGDGLFRDVDGDGDVTHADVQAFFDVQHRPTWKQPERFDFNGNEVVGHGDVVALFEHVATQGL